MNNENVEIGSRIKKLRQNKKMTQKDLADKLQVSQTAIALWENGNRGLTLNIVNNISDILEVSAGYILFGTPDIKDTISTPEDANTPKKRKGVVINVYGRVAAGVPLEMIGDIVDTEEITPEMAKTGDFFGLKIKGDSMTPRIEDGDIVIVRQQDDAETGDTVIATVNGTDATCKRLKKYRDGIELIATNPSYEPLFFTNEEIEQKPVRILGRVVELRRTF